MELSSFCKEKTGIMANKALKHSYNGFFITFEGPEGSGKSTQVRKLAEHFAARGREVLVTREPGGTPLAERMRTLVKNFDGPEKMHASTELLLMEAARAQHVREKIRPALAAGTIVICDRFADSTTAYQGGARGIEPPAIDFLNRFAMAECVPDLTFLLDLPPEIGFARTSIREETRGEHDRFEEEKYPWPTGGEIDIMERLNFDTMAYQTVHTTYTYHLGMKDNPPQGSTGAIRPEDYNVYAVEMWPDSLVFFINDSRTFAYPRIETEMEGQFPFDKPYYLLIDMQLGGSWVGKVDTLDLPVEMRVDWVRYYTKE